MKPLFLPFQPNFPFVEGTMEAFDYYGYLSKVVQRVNELQKIIEELDIDEIKNELELFKIELKREVNGEVEQTLNEFEIKINEDVQTYLNNYITYFNTQVEILRDEVDEKIENIELGEIDIMNPMTGQMENINVVVNDLYDLLRDGISAEEFDDLELTATEFDSLEITAYDFDFKGKEILINE